MTYLFWSQNSFIPAMLITSTNKVLQEALPGNLPFSPRPKSTTWWAGILWGHPAGSPLRAAERLLLSGNSYPPGSQVWVCVNVIIPTSSCSVHSHGKENIFTHGHCKHFHPWTLQAWGMGMPQHVKEQKDRDLVPVSLPPFFLSYCGKLCITWNVYYFNHF